MDRITHKLTKLFWLTYEPFYLNPAEVNSAVYLQLYYMYLKIVGSW